MKEDFTIDNSTRIELKDVIRPRDKSFLEKLLILSSWAFYKPYPQRIINSLYFDSIDFSSIRDSLEGFSKRTKKRLRWYGPLKSAVSTNLEYKFKHAHLSAKETSFDYCSIDPSAEKWNSFFSNDKWAALSLGDYSFPRSVVSYQRTYYQSKNKKIRVTFDEDIRFYDQHLGKSPNLENARYLSDKLIVEIKVAYKDQYLAKDMQKVLPFSPRRFSKYCESHFSRKPTLC